MALDGIYLSFLSKEIQENLDGKRIEKIYQPSKDELVISFRGKGNAKKLYICTNASCPRINLTDKEITNPANPPMFCMLMRKHLGGAKFINISQLSLDRIVFLSFEARNEFGDAVILKLAVEIMNRHSNLILINNDEKIIDCIKRVDISMSKERQILPGIYYTLPPKQSKLSILTTSAAEIANQLKEQTRNDLLDKALMNILEGISPVIAREITFFVCKDDVFAKDLSKDQHDRFVFFIENMKNQLIHNTPKPVALFTKKGVAKDFAFMAISQYGIEIITKPEKSCSILLDNFYSEKSENERVRQRASDLMKMLANTTDRLSKKIQNQEAEIKTTAKRDAYKTNGDIVSANLYKIKKGDKFLFANDFYTGDEVKINLDEKLSPAQNAQKLYKLYKKAASAEVILQKQIIKAKEELIYIDSVFDLVSRTTSNEEIIEIKDELFLQGYIKRQDKKQVKKKMLKPKKYISSDGFIILSGRNNIQNDTLTLKTSKNNDLWFHTKDIPGSHTVILAGGAEIPDRTILEAATVAAYNSKGKFSSQVPVDYTEIKNVKKPSAAKPGMVIYLKNKTVFVKPDEEIIKELRRD